MLIFDDLKTRIEKSGLSAKAISERSSVRLDIIKRIIEGKTTRPTSENRGRIIAVLENAEYQFPFHFEGKINIDVTASEYAIIKIVREMGIKADQVKRMFEQT